MKTADSLYNKMGEYIKFKKALALLGTAAMIAVPSVASAASSISSPSSPVVLQGPASLGSDYCELTLTVALAAGGTSGTVVSGTNTPSPSGNCVNIYLTGGAFTVSDYGASGDGTALANVSNLQINGGYCNTGAFTGLLENISSTEIALYIAPGTMTACGPISADIVSTSPSPVQVVD